MNELERVLEVIETIQQRYPISDDRDSPWYAIERIACKVENMITKKNDWIVQEKLKTTCNNCAMYRERVYEGILSCEEKDPSHSIEFWVQFGHIRDDDTITPCTHFKPNKIYKDVDWNLHYYYHMKGQKDD